MRRNNFGFCALFLSCVLLPGCGPNSTILNSGAKPPPANTVRPPNVFENDLETMRTANLDFIFVLRRKDGAKLDADDKKFIRTNSPEVANRLLLSDDDKALIAGSTHPFPPEKLKPLQERFDFQDFSKAANTDGQKNENGNTN
jgi:hypothetical protein